MGINFVLSLYLEPVMLPFLEKMNVVKSQTEKFLTTQSLEYQKHVTHIRELETTLQYQHLIQSQKTIPKVYTPKPPQTSNPLLTEKFKQEYCNLFFHQLERAIESNSISLELHRAASKSIVTQTEQHLASLNLTPDDVTEMYHQFISQNNIKEHTPLPAIQMVMKNTASTPHSPTPVSQHSKKRKRHQKRKRCEPQPPAIKFHKPVDRNSASSSSSFLDQRHHQLAKPP